MTKGVIGAEGIWRRGEVTLEAGLSRELCEGGLGVGPRRWKGNEASFPMGRKALPRKFSKGGLV